MPWIAARWFPGTTLTPGVRRLRLILIWLFTVLWFWLVWPLYGAWHTWGAWHWPAATALAILTPDAGALWPCRYRESRKG
jgi:hypothetical protein